MKIKVKLLISTIIIILFYHNSLSSLENKIVYKINNQIITSLDIEDEINYLLTLNPNLNNLNKNEILQISKRSIINEKIKKIEIEKFYEKSEIPEKYLEQLLVNVYSPIGISNIEDFKKYIKTKNVSYQNITSKITTEALWNEIIVLKFSSKIKINEKDLRKKIQNAKNKTLKSYLMSEIFFEVDEVKNLEKKYQEISKTINAKGFANAALKYSISQTSNIGGKLNWISENSLNKKIKEKVNSIKNGEFTKPITVPGGFLILKINETKIIQADIDAEKELKKIIKSLKNNQLSQFSKMYFNKVKKDIKINEI